MWPLIATVAAFTDSPRAAGILYELWHCEAATAMAQVKARGLDQLTTETVIRSNGGASLDQVYPAAHGPFASADIWNVEPAELGFYCLCSKRTDNDTLPDCPKRTAVAQRHAELLTSAGFDYVALDITNWPQVNAATDVAVLRPLENLFDLWLALRSRGINTPAIAVWCLSPVAAYADGHETTWQWLLDHVYNNATRAPLLWSRVPGKATFFLPATSAYNASVDRLIQSNGGRDNIDTIKMWALSVGKGSSTWGFFSPCTQPDGKFTTSMVGTGRPCEQFAAMGPGGDAVEEVSASGGYMLTQCSLPFAAPGHLRGLTLQRTFAKVLEVGAPNLFVSSFNEHIGGRQKPVYSSEIAFNMGLPSDTQRGSVWVDTYGAEFSRDIEPTVEGGSRVWEVARSCVKLYKAKLTCASSSSSSSSSSAAAAAAAAAGVDLAVEPCCTTGDKEVYANAWSLVDEAAGDALVTNSQAERDALVAGGGWKEVCNPINGPSVFCADGSMAGGRNGPFMLYSTPDASMAQLPNATLLPLRRCLTSGAPPRHFLSLRADCEAMGKPEFVVGYVSSARGWETLRALRRCGSLRTAAGAVSSFSHALDLGCHGGGGTLLGYVR